MRFGLVAGGLLILAAFSGVATAAPVTTTIVDTTADIAFHGSSPTGWFGGSDQGDVIGTGFDTSKIVVTEKLKANGGLKLDFKLHTQFSGTDCFGSTCAYYGDLFLRTPATGYSATPFDYAITLGDQGPNGGLSTTALYKVGSYATSQDIWSGRTGFIYGGEYIPDDDSAAAELAPTVLLSGSHIANATVSQTEVAHGYIEDVSLDLTAAEAAPFLGGFDLFWGTGDCANDSVFGSVTPVPEPAALAIFVMGLMGLGMIPRRDVRNPEIENTMAPYSTE